MDVFELEDISVTFDDVGGYANLLDDLKSEVVFSPSEYAENVSEGLTNSKILFHGPDGTGKTLVAHAVAAECNFAGRKTALLTVSGRTLMAMRGTEGAMEIEELFREAKRLQPSIIFIDELECFSSDQTIGWFPLISVLRQKMDWMGKREQVVMIGATNNINAVDDSLLRAHRFFKRMPFTLPSLQARREILDIHVHTLPIIAAPTLLDEVAAACRGKCGKDIKALVHEATASALRGCFFSQYKQHYKQAVFKKAMKVGRHEFTTAFSMIGTIPRQWQQMLDDAAVPEEAT